MRTRDSSWTAASGLRNINLGRHLLSTYNRNEAKDDKSESKKSETKIEKLPLSSDDEELSELSSICSVSEPETESQDSRSQKSSSQDARPVTSAKEEPAIDAAPVSSSEDESSDEDLEFQRTKKRPVLETYDQKRRAGGFKGATGESDEDAPMFSWSSQRSKRAKTSTYGTGLKIRVPRYVPPPSRGSEPSSSQSRSEVEVLELQDIKTDKTTGKKAGKRPASPPDAGIDLITTEEIHTSCPKLSKLSSGFKMLSAIPVSSNSNSSLAPSSFVEPLSMDLDGNDSPLSPLSSPPSSLASEPQEPRPALCPMCQKEVDPGLLEVFLAQPKQRVREQQQFCASHQQNSAEKEWESHGYPSINWNSFDERVQKHFPALEKLLVPDCSSYFRNLLDSALKSGKAQNFRLTLAGDGLETISCGYYGTKGSGKMLQALTDRFALKLRRLATSDHIVKQAGVVGYAQSVLVPELAVRLVKEDMGVGDDAARQILRESITLGEKVNPATDDEVPIPEDLATSFEDDD